MTFLNVAFGLHAFLPSGWIFMIFVIVMECLLLSKFLSHKWFDKRIYCVVSCSNFISGIIGIVISVIVSGGWWLVVWFPWVGNKEVFGGVDNPYEALKWLVVYYVCAFILTIILETITNWFFLGNQYKTRKILKASLVVNIISYAIGTIVLYSYSFS